MTAVATNFKVSAADLLKDIKEAVAAGYLQGKALYQATITIMLEKVKNLSCEQLIDADVSI